MSSTTTALILAGGKGKRFRPYTDLIPKPMIPLGKREKPILEYIVRLLSTQGFEKIVLLVGYKWRYIYNYFGRGEKHGVRIEYSIDDGGYGGTGGAVLKAVKEGLVGGEDFLVWYGDILTMVNTRNLMEMHKSRNAAATLLIASKYQVPVGVVKPSRDGRIVEVLEKPWIDLNVFIGVAVFNKEEFLDQSRGLGRSFDIMGDLMPKMAQKSKIYAHIHDGPWFDVGSLERYEKLSLDFIESIEERLFGGIEEPPVA